MSKRLITILFLLAVAGNSLAVLPPQNVGAECCVTARQEGAAAVISGLCCITECRQAAETPPSISTLINLKPQLVANTIFTQRLCLQPARFPLPPTRFLYGSPHRYLDLSALLI
jgi:hypothetical protein